MECPCFSGSTYELCCQSFHEKKRLPSSPLELMKSRYSAYSLGLADYIIETTHPNNPSYRNDRLVWRREILLFCASTTFSGLKILATAPNKVTFKALLKVGDRDASFKEESTFEKLNSEWLYLSGKMV